VDTAMAIAAMRRSALFSSTPPKYLTELLSTAEEQRFKAGEYIFWEAETPDRFFLLLSGRVKVVKHGSQGRETVVGFFNSGDIFGEVAVIEDKPYPASALAVEDVTALAINRQAFRDFIGQRPAVALAMVGILSARLREAQSRLHDLAGERVEQRLARTLERLSSKLGRELPFTRQDLADMSGTTLETAVRFLSRLKKESVISSKRGLVVIEDVDKLRLLAEGSPETR
jgi:CRP-like cAMP-binding protein